MCVCVLEKRANACVTRTAGILAEPEGKAIRQKVWEGALEEAKEVGLRLEEGLLKA